MTIEPAPRRPGLAYAVAVIGAFLIVAALVWTMRRYVQPAPLDRDRAAFRAKTLGELRAAENDAIAKVAWIDQAKGLVRLRVEDAMQIVEREWGRNASAARSNLIARVAKATAEPPKPPEKKSDFE